MVWSNEVLTGFCMAQGLINGILIGLVIGLMMDARKRKKS